MSFYAKLWSLNEENENGSMTQHVSKSKKEGVLQLRELLQLQGIRYLSLSYHCSKCPFFLEHQEQQLLICARVPCVSDFRSHNKFFNKLIY